MFKKNPQPQPSPALEEPASSTELVSRRAKLEDERMSRRQALRKVGILSGVAVLALVSVDDLARLAAKQLAAHSGDSEVAGSVAKSLRGAGVAFAAGNPNDPFGPKFGEYWADADTMLCHEECNTLEAHYWETFLLGLSIHPDPVKAIKDNCTTTLTTPKHTPTQSEQDACFISGAVNFLWDYPIAYPNDAAAKVGLARQAAVSGFGPCCNGRCDKMSYDGSDKNGPCYLDPDTLIHTLPSLPPVNP